jgi:hypothetical protein
LIGGQVRLDMKITEEHTEESIKDKESALWAKQIIRKEETD